MKVSNIFALLVLAAVPLAAQASSNGSPKLSNLRSPGEWQFTVVRRVKVPGTKMSIPPKTVTKKICLTRKAIDQPLDDKLKALSNLAQKKGEVCKQGKQTLTGKTLTFVMSCSGKRGRTRINGKRIYDSKETSHSHVHLSTTTNGMPMEISLDTHAKRIGACKASTP